MAYFDSSKNRALWEIRLGELRKARAMRESGLTEESFQEETQSVFWSGVAGLGVAETEFVTAPSR